MRAANFPRIPVSLFPCVAYDVRPAGAQNTMTPILVMGPNECVFPDCSSMAFPVLGDSDLVFFISYGEIVQWLINGSSPTLAAKSAAAVPFSTPFIDGTHASTTLSPKP